MTSAEEGWLIRPFSRTSGQPSSTSWPQIQRPTLKLVRRCGCCTPTIGGRGWSFDDAMELREMNRQRTLELLIAKMKTLSRRMRMRMLEMRISGQPRFFRRHRMLAQSESQIHWNLNQTMAHGKGWILGTILIPRLRHRHCRTWWVAEGLMFS